MGDKKILSENIDFQNAYARLYEELGTSKKMVLSTSLDNIVTSRMMSIVILNERFYFQTDKTFRKYRQLKENGNVSLCIDNIEIEGYCEEAGIPLKNAEFANAYKRSFPGSYERYTSLKNERLFVISPVFIERWLYIHEVPYIETFDIRNERYRLVQYQGE